jgi:hypothetical protein
MTHCNLSLRIYESVLINFSVNGLSANAQQTRSSGFIPMGLHKSIQDRLAPVVPVPMGRMKGCPGPSTLYDFNWQMFHRDHAASAEDKGMLHYVL